MRGRQGVTALGPPGRGKGWGWEGGLCSTLLWCWAVGSDSHGAGGINPSGRMQRGHPATALEEAVPDPWP